MSLRSKVIRGVMWSTAERIARQGFAFVVFAALARLLTKDDFGLVALGLIYTGFVELFINQGFATAIVQRREVEPGHLDTVFWVTLCVAAVLAAGTIACAPWISEIFHEPRLTPLLRALALAFPLAGAGVVPAALLSRSMAFDRIAAISLCSALLSGAAALVCAWRGLGAWSLVVQQLVINTVTTVGMWVAARWRPGTHATWRHFNDLRAFGWTLTGNNILFFISRKGDEAIVGRWLSVAALGLYSQGNRLVTTVFDLLTAPSSAVALPALARRQDDPAALRKGFIEGTHFISAVAFPAMFGLAVVAPLAVPLIFGAQWSPAAPVVQVLCIAGIFKAAQGMVHSCFLATGQTWVYTMLFVLHAVVTLVSSLIAVRWGRAEHVAWAQVLANLITGAANFAVLRSTLRYSLADLLGGWGRVLLPCAVMAAAVWLLEHELAATSLPRPVVLLAACCLGATVYLGIAMVTLRGPMMRVVSHLRPVPAAALETAR